MKKAPIRGLFYFACTGFGSVCSWASARTQGARASSTLRIPRAFQQRKHVPTPQWKLKSVLPKKPALGRWSSPAAVWASAMVNWRKLLVEKCWS